MELLKSPFSYGHTGDVEILTNLKEDAKTDFTSGSSAKRSQVNPGGGQLNISGAAALRPFVEMGLYQVLILYLLLQVLLPMLLLLNAP